ncbi:unnamed protein product [Orchesella dallaii]|uniref:Gustatory receptor n=1 Tax=Orchesella dallaii TaxID=48710 RepID=A0ABP1R5E2_9HEXA
MAAFTCFFADVLPLLDLFRKRRSVENFQSKLTEFIVGSVESFRTDVGIPVELQRRFASVYNAAKRLRFLIVGGFFGVTIETVITQILGVKKFFGCMFCQYFIFPLSFFTAYWHGALFLRLFTRIWVISLIRCMTIGILALKIEIRDLTEAETDWRSKLEIIKLESSVKIRNTLQKFRVMETLVEEFNSLFGIFISVGILSVIVTLLINVFEMILHLRHGGVAHSLGFATSVVVHIVVLYFICRSAGELEFEAKDCIMMLQDSSYKNEREFDEFGEMLHYTKALLQPVQISPGYFFNLNLKTMLSIAGSITTYMIVLVQFHTSEPPVKRE